MCPDALTNETQMRPLYDFSDEPFCVLELRSEFLLHPSTPTRAIRKASAVAAHSSGKKRHLQAAVVSSESEASDNDAVSPAKKVRLLAARKGARTLF
jgi:hypothetical protein